MTERGGAERRRSGDPRKTQRTRTNAGPIRREDEAAIRRLVRDLIERSFGGSAAKLVVQALASERASPE